MSGQVESADELFPLPVTPFEYYYLCDDRPDYPTLFPIELAFEGRLEREPFEVALKSVLPRHPLLSARIDFNNGGRPNWIAGEGPGLQWTHEDAPRSGEGQRIDLARSPGLRVTVRQGSDTTRALFEFHHACCDGRGGFLLIEDVLLAYHAACDSSSPPLPPLDSLRLHERGEFGTGGPHWWSGIADVWKTIAFWARLAARTPIELAAPADLKAGDTLPPLPYRTSVLEGEQVRLLRSAAAEQQATLNDLLLRDVLLAVAAWNADHGAKPGPLRINVPISRLERSEIQMPAANLLSFAFVTRRLRAGADTQRLLDSIRRETEKIRRDRETCPFVAGLAFACCIPGLIPWVLGWRQSLATIVLSNVGKVFSHTPLPRRDKKLVCGQAVLKQVTAVPPIRPYTRAAIAVIQYGGEATINLHCDSKCFGPEHADDLLARYVARLEQSAGVRQTPSPSES